jgi:hypothetical protein
VFGLEHLELRLRLRLLVALDHRVEETHMRRSKLDGDQFAPFGRAELSYHTLLDQIVVVRSSLFI